MAYTNDFSEMNKIIKETPISTDVFILAQSVRNLSDKLDSMLRKGLNLSTESENILELRKEIMKNVLVLKKVKFKGDKNDNSYGNIY